MQRRSRRRLSRVYLSSRELAQLLGFETTEGAVEFLKREKLGRKLGGRWKVTLDQLQSSYPEMAAKALRSV